MRNSSHSLDVDRITIQRSRFKLSTMRLLFFHLCVLLCFIPCANSTDSGSASPLQSVQNNCLLEHFCSKNGLYSFGLSLDGDLGIWKGTKQVWSAGTCCGSGIVARLQNDGNFVVRNDKKIVWSSRTHGIPPADAKVTVSDNGSVSILNKSSMKLLTIDPSEEEIVSWRALPDLSLLHTCVTDSMLGRLLLEAGEYLCSPNGRFRFGVNLQGNLGLYDGFEEIWSAGTCCASDQAFAVLQRDGNLVVRNSNLDPLWSSRTSSSILEGDSSITVSDAGIVSLEDPIGKRVWAIASNPPKNHCRTPKNGTVVLKEGEFLCSPNFRFRFGVVNGDLSLWEYHELQWSAGCCDGAVMKFNESGHLLLQDSTSGLSLWTANDIGYPGSNLSLDNDGQVQILSPFRFGETVWTLQDWH